MDPITMWTLASTIANVGANVFSKPKRRNFSADRIFAPIKVAELQNLEAVTSPIRISAGENASARGLSGGAASQVVAQAEAPVRAASVARLNDIYARLKSQEEQSRWEDANTQRQWWGQLIGDVAGAGATYAGYLQQEKNLDALGRALGLQTEGSTTNSRALLGGFGSSGRQTTLSKAKTTGLLPMRMTPSTNTSVTAGIRPIMPKPRIGTIRGGGAGGNAWGKIDRSILNPFPKNQYDETNLERVFGQKMRKKRVLGLEPMR